MMWIVTNGDLLIELQAIRRLLFVQSKPGYLRWRLVRERAQHDMDILTYEVDLPAVPAGADVVIQELLVAVDGVDQPLQAFNTDILLARFDVKQDAVVNLSLSYVDDSGNRSETRTQEFVARDTIAPDAPGDFGEIRLIGERNEPDV